VAPVEKIVRLRTGTTIPYVEQGDPAAPAVIFLHAIGDSWHIFGPLLSALPHAIHAFALSQRGHGDASRPDTGYQTRDFADDLLAFMEALSLDRAVVVGASSGGMVARRFALDHPERTRALVLLGAPAELKDKPVVVEWWESTVSKLTDPVDPGFVRGFAENTFAEKVSAAFFETLVSESMKVPAHVWKQTYLGLLEDDSFAELPTIEAPALIIWGEQDALLTRADQERMVSAIAGSRLLVYPAAGHGFYCEDPGRVAQDIARFVAGLSRDSA
jgi:pimeloyl-ACP methyl ester carboxylesterase